MAFKRKYNLINVEDDTGLLELSEDELIDDDDSDRESIFQLSDTVSKEEETDSDSNSMQINKPSCSGVCKAATSPLSKEDNLLASDDDQTDWISVDETYLPSSNI